ASPPARRSARTPDARDAPAAPARCTTAPCSPATRPGSAASRCAESSTPRRENTNPEPPGLRHPQPSRTPPPPLSRPAALTFHAPRQQSPLMIGPDWSGDERPSHASPDRPRRVAVVTGTRAEFGLLRPVMRAVQLRSDLELLT